MKLHVVAASEILSKNLDPFFPHSQLGTDGLLVASKAKTIETPAVLVSEPEVVVESTPVQNQVTIETEIEVAEATQQPIEPIQSELKQKRQGRKTKE